MSPPPVKPIPNKPARVQPGQPGQKKGFFSFLKKAQAPVKPQTPTEKPIKEKKDILRPFREELISEWKWLLKVLHVYDYDKEEKNLLAYRKLRGWEK